MSPTKVAVVTGASAGIGEALARSLSREGLRLVLAARRLERLEALAGELSTEAQVVACDVTKKKDLRALVSATQKRFGRCDVLINNAGISGGGRFADAEEAYLDAVIATNYTSLVRATKLFLPMLLESRGHVVNIASLAGRYALPGAAVYSGTKHAVVAFSEALYHELQPLGVAVTVINPGLVETEGFPQTRIKEDRAFGRFVMPPERIAEAIVKVLRTRKGPELSVPRWLGSLQATRVLTPPLYRMVMGRMVAPRNTLENEGLAAPDDGQ